MKLTSFFFFSKNVHLKENYKQLLLNRKFIFVQKTTPGNYSEFCCYPPESFRLTFISTLQSHYFCIMLRSYDESNISPHGVILLNNRVDTYLVDRCLKL